jgi:hypothetical protein
LIVFNFALLFILHLVDNCQWKWQVEGGLSYLYLFQIFGFISRIVCSLESTSTEIGNSQNISKHWTRFRFRSYSWSLSIRKLSGPFSTHSLMNWLISSTSHFFFRLSPAQANHLMVQWMWYKMVSV